MSKTKKILCPTCDGTGAEHVDELGQTGKCPECNGTGTLVAEIGDKK